MDLGEFRGEVYGRGVFEVGAHDMDAHGKAFAGSARRRDSGGQAGVGGEGNPVEEFHIRPLAERGWQGSRHLKAVVVGEGGNEVHGRKEGIVRFEVAQQRAGDR